MLETVLSHLNLNFRVSDFLMFASLSKVISSITKDDRLRTLLIPTYVKPNGDSFLPIFNQALPRSFPDFCGFLMPKQELREVVAFHVQYLQCLQ